MKTRDRRMATGCAFVMVATNTLLLGFLASRFGQGPFSSYGQEVWYRYGSIGFLLAGAVLPGAALLFAAKRSVTATIALTAWMLAALIVTWAWAVMSAGGV